jgi:hypothetical protein
MTDDNLTPADRQRRRPGRVITLRVGDNMLSRLFELERATGQTRPEILRDALELFLAELGA